MEVQAHELTYIYKDAALTPSPIFGQLKVSSDADNTHLHVDSTWTMPDLVKEKSTKFTLPFVFRKKSKDFTLIAQSTPCDITTLFNYAIDNSGHKNALFRKTTKSGDNKRNGYEKNGVYLEIWSASQKEMTFDMSDREEHGKIYEEGDIQSFMWSKDDKYLLYIAEAKQKKSESYFKDLFCSKPDKKPNEDVTRGENNLFRESWGEAYTDMHHSVLCIFEVETGKVKVLDLDDKFPNLSVAQAVWGPDDKCVVFVGFREDPNRLGLIYCKNRRSAVYSYDLESNDVVCLTPEENISVGSPVFTPDFRSLVYFQNKANGPHASCRALMKIDWSSKEIKKVIDIVYEAKGEEFAGLYYGRMSTRHFTPKSDFLFFTTYRRSYMELYCVNIELCKDVMKVDIGEYGSCTLHDVVEPYLLVSMSSPNVRPHLKLGVFDIADTVTVKWHPVNVSSPNLKDISWNVHTLKPSLPNKDYPNLDFEIITVASEEKKNGTLIIFPHGGPHSTLSANYYCYATAFARLGYIVCIVNYRGSVGFGENSILSLLGNVGTQDVSDVLDAIEYLKKIESLGIKNVVGFGGSHGGFLIAHLIGQHPDLLKAAVLRNPVVDLSNMAVTSDIPDWCWIESGCSSSYDPLETTNPSTLEKMWEKSPIKYVKNVKTPTLFCLGQKDRRVPISQGVLFHRQLRAQNVPTSLCMYDDGHALAKVDVSSDVFMQTALWFQKYLSS